MSIFSDIGKLFRKGRTYWVRRRDADGKYRCPECGRIIARIAKMLGNPQVGSPDELLRLLEAYPRETDA